MKSYAFGALCVIAALAGCTKKPPDSPPVSTGPGTCTGVWPSYWQDPAPKFAEMWQGQQVSNVPSKEWPGPVFRISDAFPQTAPDERAAQPWRDARFDEMFAKSTPLKRKTELANEYSWLVMRYIQQGNTGSGDLERDWSICNNPVRPWYHMPFQTYDSMSGREFVHGLTREAGVQFSLRPPSPDPLATTMWAVAFYNPTAAVALGAVWRPDGTVRMPSKDVSFGEGAVIGKLLFNTATAEQMPILANMPEWTANISDPAFCNCDQCTMVEQSQRCPRSTAREKVRLLQFDIAIKDSRAPGTAWVFGTFVADGQHKHSERDPWMRISPLGLMWGNDPPPAGTLAIDHPADPRKNGFAEEVIFWDVVDRMNAIGGKTKEQHPGHLGCNGRLNGPADNAGSSCMSCHMTGSVPDRNLDTPPIMPWLWPHGDGLTRECVRPDPSDPSKGRDAGGIAATVVNGISFATIDSLYFANTAAAAPVNMTPAGASVSVLGRGVPAYDSGRSTWISTDYSLQLSMALTSWGQWKQHEAVDHKQRQFKARLPSR